ncbi:hypothetical protein Avbf_14875 [Armadillidium vulgare]|nr:hypothetical protein Avbf_14875 [Armadillidium vulgare]
MNIILNVKYLSDLSGIVKKFLSQSKSEVDKRIGKRLIKCITDYKKLVLKSFKKNLRKELELMSQNIGQTPELKSAQELEYLIFQKASKEEEYLQYVAKIIKYLKEKAENSNLDAMLGGQQRNAVLPTALGRTVNNNVIEFVEV